MPVEGWYAVLAPQTPEDPDAWGMYVLPNVNAQRFLNGIGARGLRAQYHADPKETAGELQLGLAPWPAVGVALTWA